MGKTTVSSKTQFVTILSSAQKYDSNGSILNRVQQYCEQSLIHYSIAECLISAHLHYLQYDVFHCRVLQEAKERHTKSYSIMNQSRINLNVSRALCKSINIKIAHKQSLTNPIFRLRVLVGCLLLSISPLTLTTGVMGCYQCCNDSMCIGNS